MRTSKPPTTKAPRTTLRAAVEAGDADEVAKGSDDGASFRGVSSSAPVWYASFIFFAATHLYARGVRGVSSLMEIWTPTRAATTSAGRGARLKRGALREPGEAEPPRFAPPEFALAVAREFARVAGSAGSRIARLVKAQRVP